MKENDIKADEYIVFTQEAEGITYEAKFKKEIQYLIWKLFFGHMYKQDTYNAARVLIVNQYVVEKDKPSILDDEGLVYLFIADIMGEFINLPEVNLYKTDETKEYKKIAAKHTENVYTLDVGKDVLYIRGLKMNEYSTLFNTITTDPLEAWTYIYNNLVVHKDVELDRNSPEYAACHSVPSSLLNMKQNILKKN